MPSSGPTGMCPAGCASGGRTDPRPAIRDRIPTRYTDRFRMQYIYTMKGLGKVHPPDARVLNDIWLSFLPGAKIGVLGLNGSGKSSLLRIMAGGGTPFFCGGLPAPRGSGGVFPPGPPPASAPAVE